jgi:hypothetical protein
MDEWFICIWTSSTHATLIICNWTCSTIMVGSIWTYCKMDVNTKIKNCIFSFITFLWMINGLQWINKNGDGGISTNFWIVHGLEPMCMNNLCWWMIWSKVQAK